MKTGTAAQVVEQASDTQLKGPGLESYKELDFMSFFPPYKYRTLLNQGRFLFDYKPCDCNIFCPTGFIQTWPPLLMQLKSLV